MTATGPQYTRARERQGKVSFATRVFQGIGGLPEALKDWAFSTFLLFYYNQILGLPAFTASLAIAAALVIDAVFDPLVGSFSDQLRSPLGRRHPLMFVSAAPLAVFLFMVFSPPASFGHTALALWLFVSAVGTHVGMSLFVVPYTSLYAEFSSDYTERTQLVTYRYIVGWVGFAAFTTAAWTFIFPSSHAFKLGQLNPHGYGVLAIALSLAITGAVLATTQLTRREIPYLLQPAGTPAAFTPLHVLRDIAHALANRDFLLLMIGLLLFAAVNGTAVALSTYMSTYFWQLSPEQLRWFALIIVGAVAGFLTVTPLERLFDKKTLLLASFALLVVDGSAGVALRLIDVLPENGDPRLLPIIIANETVRIYLSTILGIMFYSMIADTLDAQELRTGMRQEGMFSAATAFAGKATAGLGALIGGALLQYAIHWPAKADASHITPRLVAELGIVAGILVPMLFVLPFAVGTFYQITREEHARIRSELQARRQATHAPPAQDHPANVMPPESVPQPTFAGVIPVPDGAEPAE